MLRYAAFKIQFSKISLYHLLKLELDIILLFGMSREIFMQGGGHSLKSYNNDIIFRLKFWGQWFLKVIIETFKIFFGHSPADKICSCFKCTEILQKSTLITNAFQRRKEIHFFCGILVPYNLLIVHKIRAAIFYWRKFKVCSSLNLKKKLMFVGILKLEVETLKWLCTKRFFHWNIAFFRCFAVNKWLALGGHCPSHISFLNYFKMKKKTNIIWCHCRRYYDWQEIMIRR
jgi:hypothetical protein